MASLPDPSSGGGSSFQQVVSAFLAAPGQPFASVLSAERIERVFAKYGNLFGERHIYSTAVVVWGFLGQVLRDGKQASCQAAVACIVAYRMWRNESTPTSDTGDYCRARAKLPEAALRELTVLVADDMQGNRRDGIATSVARFIKNWRCGRDGSVLLLIYDDRSVAEKAGASLCADAPEAACRLSPRASLGQMRSHTRLDEAGEAGMDGSGDLRFDSRDYAAARTPLPNRRGGPPDSGAHYQSLHLCHMRCKSPVMGRKELWMTLLGYNLIRTTVAAAALLHDKLPRQISFTATCQYVLASWKCFGPEQIAVTLLTACCRNMLLQIAECGVANRPGRIEPRVIKRRCQHYKLMQEPREVLKARLLAGKDLQ